MAGQRAARIARRRWRLAGRLRVRPGIEDLPHGEQRPWLGHGNDPLIIGALIESEWQQTWTA